VKSGVRKPRELLEGLMRSITKGLCKISWGAGGEGRHKERSCFVNVSDGGTMRFLIVLLLQRKKQTGGLGPAQGDSDKSQKDRTRKAKT